MPFQPGDQSHGPGNPHATADQYKPRKRRTEFEILSGVDPLDFLAIRLGKYIDAGDMQNAERICLETLPYIRPRLKSIDHQLSGSVHVTVRIGGDDNSPAGGSEGDADG